MDWLQSARNSFVKTQLVKSEGEERMEKSGIKNQSQTHLSIWLSFFSGLLWANSEILLVDITRDSDENDRISDWDNSVYGESLNIGDLIPGRQSQINDSSRFPAGLWR